MLPGALPPTVLGMRNQQILMDPANVVEFVIVKIGHYQLSLQILTLKRSPSPLISYTTQLYPSPTWLYFFSITESSVALRLSRRYTGA